MPSYSAGKRLATAAGKTLAMSLEMIVPVAFDWDRDGDTDILSGNTAGFIEFFENLSGPKIATPSWNKPVRLLARITGHRCLSFGDPIWSEGQTSGTDSQLWSDERLDLCCGTGKSLIEAA